MKTKRSLAEQLLYIYVIVISIIIISLGIILPKTLLPIYEENIYNYLKQPLFFVGDNINNSTIIQDCGNYFGLQDKSYLIPYRSFPTVTVDDTNAVSIRSVGCGKSGDEDTDVGTVGWLKLQDNVAFTSRPKSMKFGYDFTSYNNEAFQVSIILLDSNGNEIATGSFSNNASVSNAEGIVELEYRNEVTKAASIKVEFLSSTVENGSTRVGKSTVTVPMDKNGTTTQFNITTGNVLTIKGIELIYDYE